MGKDFKNIQMSGNAMEMKKHLDIDSDRVNKMIEIKLKVFNRELTPEEAQKLVNATFESISAEEFAYGEQDKAEFWLDRGDKFIYIVYDAVRDEEGNFRGDLEMMQDVTHIRSLKGSQRLLSWKNPPKSEREKTNQKSKSNGSFEITPKMIVGTRIR